MTVVTVGVAGAGTMGAGIAQIAALGGFETHLHDPDPDALEAGLERLKEGLAKGAARRRWSEDDANAAAQRVRPARRLEDLGVCELVIEAAPEDLGLKREIFSRLAAACTADAILATNTSSLQVVQMASAVPNAERLVGMHFFNPPALMELVEIVAAPDSSEEALAGATDVATRMARTPIRAADGPGFLANRLARPFGLEGLRMLGEGVATHDEIDRILRIGGGFRMGPFELMDLVGIDVGFEVSKSFYEQSFNEPRWRPHPIQARMTAAGRHGRKTGRGYYDYSTEPYRPADPEIELDRPVLDDTELAAIAGPAAPAVLTRLSAAIVNEAAFALEAAVGSPEDMDTAMRLGFNWPIGPIEWSERFGLARAVGLLDELRELHGEAYRAAPLLRRVTDLRTKD